MSTRRDPSRSIRAPRGNTLSCKSWLTEAAYRMLQNNLDPEVAENPTELVVYGGIGRAARDWECYDAILESLRDARRRRDAADPVRQAGRRVPHAPDAPRVLLANSNLVPHWATWEHFNELDRKGLMMYGQMTAGSWIYIGSQGIVQGTYETFVEMGRQHYGGDLTGKWILTAGLGGMGGAQPLAASLAGACSLNIECQQSRIDMRLRTRYVDEQATDLDDALARIDEVHRGRRSEVDRAARQRRRDPAGAGAPRRAPGRGDRPDLRARSRCTATCRSAGPSSSGCAEQNADPEQRARRREEVDARARRGDARVPATGHPDVRLRQQHPPDGEGRRLHERVRLPRLRARLRAAAVLPRRRPVPLGRAAAAIRKTSTRPTRRSRN